MPEAEDKPSQKPNFPFQDDLPIRSAFFRMMRAVMFEPHPIDDMDTLPLAQLRLMWTVFRSHEATMKDISELLQVSQSTVTQAADKLVRRGLIERVADPLDRRVVRLKMTGKGQEILSASDAERNVFFQAVWEGMTPAERTLVSEGMEMLVSHAEKTREAAGHHLPNWGMPPPRPEEGEKPSEMSSQSQPVVDLMSRRIRGRG